MQMGRNHFKSTSDSCPKNMQAIELAKEAIENKDYLKAEKICRENIKDSAILDLYFPMLFSKEYMSMNYV